MNAISLSNKITSKVNRIKLIAKKHSPEIAIGTGIVCGIAGTVCACNATLKAEEVLDKFESDKNIIKKTHDAAIEQNKTDEYSEQDYNKDLVIAYTKTGVEMAKLYAPAVALGALSISCVLYAHNIMSKRQVALAAAYTLSQESFDSYRSRVREELGEDKDFEFANGVVEEEVETVNKKGKTVTKKVKTFNPDQIASPYARFFDECNPNWSPDASQNRFFIQCVQNQMNDKLRAEGHLFLNDVYRALGFKDTTEGQLVGWIYNDDNIGQGDGFVDFDLYDSESAEKRYFINGYESSVLLDFNVDGVVYELI